MTEAGHHLFPYVLVILRLEAVTAGNGDHRMIWRNEAPNSSVGLGVGFLIPEKETNSDLLDMIVRKIDEVREKVESGGDF